jgi:hypothetical protein
MVKNEAVLKNKSAANRLYVFENTTGTAISQRRAQDKSYELMLEGFGRSLSHCSSSPRAMAFGSDGMIYVSNVGFDPPPNGLGQILRITQP